MIKRIVLLLLCIATLESADCQVPLPDNYLVSPNAATLGEYGSVPVSMYTGIPEISIPVYTLSCGNHTLPLTLSYHGGGVRPDRHPGWVGLGWHLSSGGSITRIVRGQPDESDLRNTADGHYSQIDIRTPKSGYFYVGIPTLLKDYQNGKPNHMDEDSEQYALSQYLRVEGYFDSEPDQYVFDLPGLHGSFYYDKKGDKWQVQCDRPVKVIMDINDPSNFSRPFPDDPTGEMYTAFFYSRSQSINNFKLVDDEGTIYTFGGKNNPEAIEYSVGFFSQETDELAATTWHLTSIEYMDDRKITFKYELKNFVAQLGIYENYTSQNIDRKTYTYMNGRRLDGFLLYQEYDPNFDYVQGSLVIPSYLKEISDGHTRILFDTEESDELKYDIKRFNYNHYKPLQPAKLPGMTYLKYFNPDGSISGHNYTDIDQCASMLKWHKLTGIRVEDKSGTKLVRFGFGYNVDDAAKAGKERLALLSFGEIDARAGDTIKTYRFEYDKINNLPPYCSYQIDHWDFYKKNNILTLGNSYNSTVRNYHLITADEFKFGEGGYEPFNPDQNITTAPSFPGGNPVPVTVPAASPGSPYYVARNSDHSTGTIGSLMKIIYPTGGYTRFVYEGNTYRAVVDTTRTTIEAFASPQVAGGIRVKKVIVSADGSNGSEDTVKEYLYYDAMQTQNPYNATSGILLCPRQYRYVRGGFEWENKLAGKIQAFTTVYSSQSLFPIATNGDGTHIGYTHVTEKYPDGSMTVNHFTNFDNGHIDDPYQSDNARNLGACFPYSSKSQERGLLYQSDEYDSSHKLIRQTVNEYSNLGDTASLNTMKVCYHGYSIVMVRPGQNESFIREIYRTKLYTYSLYPLKQTIIDFNGNGQKAFTRYFSYNADKQVNIIRDNFADGSDIYTKYLYPGDYDNEVSRSLTDRHCLNTVIKQCRHRVSSGTQIPLDSTVNVFSVANLVYPSETRSYNGSCTVPLTSKYSFGHYFNPIYMEKAGGEVRTVYIWGYSHRYPVAVVNGATVEEVTAILGSLDNFAAAGNPDFRKLETLRRMLPDALVTVYKYLPGVGISEIVQPDGVLTKYNYRSNGRLSATRDADDNFINVYDYNYAGKTLKLK